MDRIIWKRIGRSLLVLFGITLLILAIIYVTPLVYPFIIAWLLAYFINPVVNMLHRKLKVPRWLGVALSLLLFVSAILTIATAAVTRIIVEIIRISKSLTTSIDWLSTQFQAIIASPEIQNMIIKINSFYQNNPNYQETINTRISSTANLLAHTSTTMISYILNSIINLLASLPNVATLMVIVMLAAFFIGKDWKINSTKMNAWVPEHIRQSTIAVWTDLQKALFGYLRAHFILISITAVVVTIGLLILRVEYAISIGLLIGLVDLLPYLGVGVVMVPWIAYTFINGNVTLGIELSILYVVVLITRQILEPKVLASSVGLEPLPTLIAMFAGLKLFGILGLIIGPVSLVILSAIHKANVFKDIYSYIMKGSK